ncbi:MAG: low specificity L-threonine aldolase [Sphaerochaetaceae bacterium]|nr:low specificity L-threonine aldolase [Sphaerochaetaceae bacterium]
MINFASDYTTGCAPEILNAFSETNLIPTTGYGTDIYCESAKEKIKLAINLPDAEVEFICGGTQTNQLVIDCLLQQHQGVIAPITGHISVHESGAIEYSGHKVLGIKSTYGKISAKDIDTFIDAFYSDPSHDAMVYPGLVYISQPTEYGTLYSYDEMNEISTICHSYDLPLYVDGARLGYALNSPENNISLPQLAQLADVFYIGGTKVGALCGEAIVFTNNNRPKYFKNIQKKHGALMAKGRVLGIQFNTLFTDNLYMKLGKHGIEMAMKLKEVFIKKNIKFFLDSPTNQQFVILNKAKAKELEKNVVFEVWENIDENNVALRFCSSWSTTEEDIALLESYL